MTPKVRRALIWGGMFLLAFVGGSWLGGFAVKGLDAVAAHDSSDTENFWAAQDNEGDAGRLVPLEPVSRLSSPAPGNHVCEGCDAGITRDRQRAEEMGLPYDDPRMAAEADAAVDELDADTPQP